MMPKANSSSSQFLIEKSTDSEQSESVSCDVNVLFNDMALNGKRIR